MRKPEHQYYDEQHPNFMGLGDYVYGETGHFEMVPYKLIRVDSSYNRATMTKNNNFIAKTTGVYDPHSFRPVNLSRREDGFYYIYDGVQREDILRLLAADLSTESIAEFRIPAWVHEDMGKEDEHRALVNTNNQQTHLNIAELWKVRYDGGDGVVVELTDIFKEYGLGLGLRSASGVWAASAGHSNPLRFTSLTVLNTFVVKHMWSQDETYEETVELLRNVLEIITRSFTEGMPGYQQRLSPVIFLSLLQFVKDNPTLSKDKIVELLSHEHNPRRFADIIKWNVIKIVSRLQTARYLDIGADVIATLWNNYYKNDNNVQPVKVTPDRLIDIRTQEEAMRDITANEHKNDDPTVAEILRSWC